MNRDWKNNLSAAFLLLLPAVSLAQDPIADSLPYSLYSKKIVVYTDIGFNSAPLNLVDDFGNGIHRLKYRNNSNVVLGFGGSYKWMSGRISFTLPIDTRSTAKFGTSKYFDLGFDFSWKKVYIDVDYHQYSGFALRKAYQWNDSLTKQNPNELRPDLTSASFSVNVWQFFKNTVKMQALRGKTGAYNKNTSSFYLKYTLNVHGTASDRTDIIPFPLQDSLNSKKSSTSIVAFDMGVVPGYAIIRRYKGFQIGILGGLGFVVQTKAYTFSGTTRTFLGLAPRIDAKLMAGYNRPKFFAMFIADLDYKTIRFDDLSYRQSYYTVKLVVGTRITTKKEKRALENKKKGKKH